MKTTELHHQFGGWNPKSNLLWPQPLVTPENHLRTSWHSLKMLPMSDHTRTIRSFLNDFSARSQLPLIHVYSENTRLFLNSLSSPITYTNPILNRLRDATGWIAHQKYHSTYNSTPSVRFPVAGIHELVSLFTWNLMHKGVYSLLWQQLHLRVFMNSSQDKVCISIGTQSIDSSVRLLAA